MADSGHASVTVRTGDTPLRIKVGPRQFSTVRVSLGENRQIQKHTKEFSRASSLALEQARWLQTLSLKAIAN